MIKNSRPLHWTHNPLVGGSNPPGAINLSNDLPPQAFTATCHCGKCVTVALDPDWIASTALLLPSSVACAYLSVIVVVLWPMTVADCIQRHSCARCSCTKRVPQIMKFEVTDLSLLTGVKPGRFDG